MNKICNQCTYNGLNECNTVAGIACKLIQNKIRISELDLSKPYLNSDYYWKRLKKLKEEE